MNVLEVQKRALELLKLPAACTKVVLTLEVNKIPTAEVTYYADERHHHTTTSTFECFGTHSQELPR